MPIISVEIMKILDERETQKKKRKEKKKKREQGGQINKFFESLSQVFSK